MREIKNILIMVNEKKTQGKRIIPQMIKYFSSKDIKAHIKILKGNKSDSNETIQNADLVFSLGGDGTVLTVARLVADYGIPIIAVNFGNFGYITEIKGDEWQTAFENYVNEKSTISKRMMLNGEVIRNGESIFTSNALNEFSLTSGGISRIVNMRLLLDGTFAGSFRSDGLIISTPTGSTGYSLAAGGPIVHPEIKTIVINPICPFTLSNRPLVVSCNTEIKIEVPEKLNTGLIMTADGQVAFELKENDIVKITQSEQRAILVESGKRSFIEVVRDKLNWTGGMHA